MTEDNQNEFSCHPLTLVTVCSVIALHFNYLHWRKESSILPAAAPRAAYQLLWHDKCLDQGFQGPSQLQSHRVNQAFVSTYQQKEILYERKSEQICKLLFDGERMRASSSTGSSWPSVGWMDWFLWISLIWSGCRAVVFSPVVYYCLQLVKDVVKLWPCVLFHWINKGMSGVCSPSYTEMEL